MNSHAVTLYTQSNKKQTFKITSKPIHYGSPQESSYFIYTFYMHLTLVLSILRNSLIRKAMQMKSIIIFNMARQFLCYANALSSPIPQPQSSVNQSLKQHPNFIKNNILKPTMKVFFLTLQQSFWLFTYALHHTWSGNLFQAWENSSLSVNSSLRRHVCWLWLLKRSIKNVCTIITLLAPFEKHELYFSVQSDSLQMHHFLNMHHEHAEALSKSNFYG